MRISMDVFTRTAAVNAERSKKRLFCFRLESNMMASINESNLIYFSTLPLRFRFLFDLTVQITLTLLF